MAIVLRTLAPYGPALVALAIIARLDSPANDRFQFWYAGHLVVTGRSPYDHSAWAAAGTTYGELGGLVAVNCADPLSASCLWAYPPWTAWLLAPFGLFEPRPGLALLAAALLATSAIAALLLARSLPLSRPSLLVVLLVTVGSAPFVWDSMLGHFEPLLLIGAVLLARAIAERSASGTAASALLVSLKPHLFIALGPLALGVLLARHAWRAAAITSGAFGALAALALWHDPTALGALLGSGTKVSLTLPTTWSFATRVTPAIAPVTAVVLIVVAAAATWVAVRNAPGGLRGMALVAAGCALSLAVTPYVHLYDDVLLAPAIALSIAVLDARGRRARMLGWVTVGFGYVAVTWLAFLNGPHGDEPAWSALIPVAALIALALTMRAGPARATASR